MTTTSRSESARRWRRVATVSVACARTKEDTQRTDGPTPVTLGPSVITAHQPGVPAGSPRFRAPRHFPLGRLPGGTFCRHPGTVKSWLAEDDPNSLSPAYLPCSFWRRIRYSSPSATERIGWVGYFRRRGGGAPGLNVPCSRASISC